MPKKLEHKKYFGYHIDEHYKHYSTNPHFYIFSLARLGLKSCEKDVKKAKMLRQFLMNLFRAHSIIGIRKGFSETALNELDDLHFFKYLLREFKAKLLDLNDIITKKQLEQLFEGKEEKVDEKILAKKKKMLDQEIEDRLQREKKVLEKVNRELLIKIL